MNRKILQVLVRVALPDKRRRKMQISKMWFFLSYGVLSVTWNVFRLRGGFLLTGQEGVDGGIELVSALQEVEFEDENVS